LEDVWEIEIIDYSDERHNPNWETPVDWDYNEEED
jgi:hypothetical protein